MGKGVLVGRRVGGGEGEMMENEVCGEEAWWWGRGVGGE